MSVPDSYWGEEGPPAWHPVGRIELACLSQTSRLQGGLAFLLFLSLQLPWYTSSASGASGSASAMIAGGWRWLIWLLSLATAVYIALGAVTSWQDPAWLRRDGRRAKILIGVAALDVLLVLIAAFAAKAHPPSVAPLLPATAIGTGIGAVLGTLIALAVLGVALLDLINASPRIATSGIAGARRSAPGEDEASAAVAQLRAPDEPAAPRPAGVPDPLRIAGVDRPPAQAPAPPPATTPPARQQPSYPPQRPPEPGSGPPTGWLPPQPPPPPPL